MSTVKIKVPINGNDNEIAGWIENVSQHIDAGNDVEFINREDSTDINIGRIQLNTAGSVAIWGVGYTINQAQSIALTAGVFHLISGIHGIRVADTGASLGIHVKI